MGYRVEIDEKMFVFLLLLQPPPALASPVLEGVVNDGLQHQSVTNMRRAPEVEHVDAPQGRVSVTQAAASKVKRERERAKCFGVRTCGLLSHALSANCMKD